MEFSESESRKEAVLESVLQIFKRLGRRTFIAGLAARVMAVAAAVFIGDKRAFAQYGCSLCFNSDPNCCSQCTGGYGLWCWLAEGYPFQCCECVAEGYPCFGCDGVICSCIA